MSPSRKNITGGSSPVHFKEFLIERERMIATPISLRLEFESFRLWWMNLKLLIIFEKSPLNQIS